MDIQTNTVPSIMEAAGATPLVAIAPPEGRGTLSIKCEFLNPGGSHKIRAAIAMVAAAERRNELAPGRGDTVVIATGGNLGVAMSIVCNRRGYGLVAVTPDNYSVEKRDYMNLQGARVVLADSSLGRAAHGDKAVELALNNPGWVLLNQFDDPSAVAGHRVTGLEIREALDGGPDLDCFVAGIGSGAHLMGIAPVLRERWPQIQVVAVQPAGCDISVGRTAHHNIQGLAAFDSPPPLVDFSLIDQVVEVTDDEAFDSARRLMLGEGIAVGPSTGANVAACGCLVASSKRDMNIVTIAYDTAAGYVQELRTG